MMYTVTLVTPSGYVYTATMSKERLDDCGHEIIEAIKISD